MNKAEQETAVELLDQARKLLQEVRTGEDFECVCWEAADKIKEFLNKQD